MAFRDKVIERYPAAICTGCYSMNATKRDRYVIYDNAAGKNVSRERLTVDKAWEDAAKLLEVA